jgi:hypothetical protein
MCVCSVTILRGLFVPTQLINFAFVPHHLRFFVVGVVSLFWSEFSGYYFHFLGSNREAFQTCIFAIYFSPDLVLTFYGF